MAGVEATTQWADYNSVVFHKGVTVAVGKLGSIARSLDSGKTWRPEKSPTQLELLAIANRGDTLVVVGAVNTVLFSFDFGITWRQEKLPIPSPGLVDEELLSVQTLPNGITYVTGDYGTIYMFDGQDWIGVYENGFAASLFVKATPSGDVFVFQSYGQVLKQRKNQAKFDVVGRLDLLRLQNVFFFSDSVAVAYVDGYSHSIFLRTRDAWRTFTADTLALSLIYTQKAFQLSDSRLALTYTSIALGNVHYGLLVSSDSGVTWKKKPITGDTLNMLITKAVPLGKGYLFVGIPGVLGRVENIDTNTVDSLLSIPGFSCQTGPGRISGVNRTKDGLLYTINGSQGQIRATIDYGRTWKPIGARALTFSRICHSKESQFATTAHELYVGSFDGQQFVRLPIEGIPVVPIGYDVSFDDAGVRGYFCGVYGSLNERVTVVHQTTDAGSQWVKLDTINPRPPGLSNDIVVSAEPFGGGYAVLWQKRYSSSPKVSERVEYRAVENGQVKVRFQATSAGLRHIPCSDSVAVVAFSSPDSSMITRDGGVSWNRIRTPFNASTIQGRLFEVSSGVLCGLYKFDRLWMFCLSADNGNTWIVDSMATQNWSDFDALGFVNSWIDWSDTTFVVAFTLNIYAIVKVPLLQFEQYRKIVLSTGDHRFEGPQSPQLLGAGPSPASSELAVRVSGLVPGVHPISLTLHDMNGALVADWSAVARASISGPDATFQVSLPSEAVAGVYLVKLQTADGIFTQKVIVLR